MKLKDVKLGEPFDSAIERRRLERAQERMESAKDPYRRPARYIAACAAHAWHLRLWSKSTGEEWRSPFACRSWRHAGPCRQARGRQDFTRIREALKIRENWVYLVLTFHRDKSKEETYEGITRCLQSLRQWIQRHYEGPAGGKPLYICVVEAHKDGYPHLNVVMNWPGLVAAVEADWKAERQRVKEALKRCSFGYICWLEMVRSPEKIAGYFTKILIEDSEDSNLPGEISKQTQAPIDAPAKFRRLRASQGLLPPVSKNEDLTGELLKFPLDVVSEPFILYSERDSFEGSENASGRKDKEKTGLSVLQG